MEKQETLQNDDEENEVKPGLAALHRYLQETGLGFTQLREYIANARQRDIYIYGITIKWPTKKNPGFFLLIRALTPDGAVVGFHSDYQLLGALIGLGQRLRSGGLEWQKDEYPPDDWAERLAFMHNQNTTG